MDQPQENLTDVLHRGIFVRPTTLLGMRVLLHLLASRDVELVGLAAGDLPVWRCRVHGGMWITPWAWSEN